MDPGGYRRHQASCNVEVLRGAVLIFLCAGCLDSHLVPCGDLACPQGDECVAGTCVTPDQLAACAGQVDGTTCTTTAIAVGHCVAGVCRASICGDGIVEYGEACDDGNEIGGDGCSATCDSTEVCGNGVVDFREGEQCDDGNFLSGDGCSSRCIAEASLWQVASPTPISTRYAAGIAYDPTIGKVIVFGGAGPGAVFSDTWLWDGTTWALLDPPTSPPARGRAAMTYDPIHHRTVLFGGTNGNKTGFADTWLWDGITWTEASPATSPPALIGASLAADPQCGCLVLFGGHTMNDTASAMTWLWDGTTWTESTTPAALAARGDAAMAYDATLNAIVLFGGDSSLTGNTVFGDTWQWDGTTQTWSSVSPTTAPSARAGASLVYVPAAGRVLLFGGNADLSATGNLNDTWVFNGTTWTQLTAPGPSVRAFAAITYDAARGVAVLIGGTDGVAAGANVSGTSLGDAWDFNGSWSARDPVVAPSARTSASMSYDVARARMVLFGGTDGVTKFGDTWEWDGTTWFPKSPASSPSPRDGQVMVYDVRRARDVLYGGQAANGTPLGDLWEWDGTTWTQTYAPSTGGPAGRAEAALTYDVAHDVVIMFGGHLAVQSFGDAWSWDAVTMTWTQLPDPFPGAVTSEPTLAYDPVRQRVVAAAGFVASNNALHNATFEWDGNQWTEIMATGQPGLSGARVVYDPLRERVVAFGGQDAALGLTTANSYEWNGEVWSERTTDQTPPGRREAAVAYDMRHGKLVVFGGQAFGAPFGDTWLGFYAPSTATPPNLCPTGDDCGEPDHCEAGVDTDGDGLADCADPDCWARCTPLCFPNTACAPDQPHCGDGTCSVVEDYLMCPADCPAP